MCRVKTKQGLKRKFGRFMMKSLYFHILPDSNSSNFGNLNGQGVKSCFLFPRFYIIYIIGRKIIMDI